MLQNHVGKHEGKLDRTKEQLGKVEEERDRALHELKEMQEMAEEANSRVDIALAANNLSELNYSEKEARLNTGEEEEVKENNTESSNHETETELMEKQASSDKLKEEMDNVRSSEEHASGLLSGCQKRIQELEAELHQRKESEANLHDSMVMQTKQLEQNKVLLEESNVEIASLRKKVEELQGSVAHSPIITGESEAGLVMSDGEKLDSSMDTKTLLEELSFLKNELKLATEAEENSKKAMDDLALALKEVATEAKETKDKLTLSQVELEHSREDVDHLRAILRRTEDTYKQLLEETRKEADRNSNAAERLRLEAEESLLAWNTETTEFVNCIRRAEEERSAAQEEASRLQELLRVAEKKSQVSKEENQKLRDILKQALNEANVAKEAAGIAKAENSQLQDMLARREEALKLVAQENEMLKIHENAAFENIKELKRLLSETPVKEFKNEDKEKSAPTKEPNKEDKEVGKKAKVHNAPEKEHKEGKTLSKTFSLNLRDIIAPHKQHKEGSEDANKETDDDALKGSIFDAVSTPDSPTHPDGEIVSSDDLDHLDESHFDDTENNSRKRRALLRRFGDLIRRRSYHRKEPSNEERLTT